MLSAHRKRNAFDKIPTFLRSAFLVYMTFVLIAAIAAAPFTSFLRKIDVYDYNILFLLGGVALGCIAVALTYGIRTLRAPSIRKDTRIPAGRRFTIFIAIGCVLLLAVKLWITYQAYFIGYNWDPSVLTRGVHALNTGMVNKMDEIYGPLFVQYLERYPNNVFIASLFSLIDKAAITLGIGSFYALDAVGCIIIVISVGLAACVARRLAGTTCGTWVFVLATLLIGFSPWSFVPYTDSYGIFVPILILYLYTCLRNPSRWALIVFVSCIGYAIKPTLLAPLGAVIIVEACRALSRHFHHLRERSEGSAESAGSTAPKAKEERARFAIIGLSCILALGLGIGATALMKSSLDIPELDPNQAFNAAHYLKMGANLESGGSYDQADYNDTASQPTQEAKTTNDLAIWQQRVSDMGIAGIAELVLRKTLTNCTVGTFDWAQSRVPQPYFLDPLGRNSLIRSFYGIEDRSGPDGLVLTVDEDWTPPPWVYIAQVLWMLTLVGVVLNWCRRRLDASNAIPDASEFVMAITLLILCIFLLIFEAGGRYLFVFSPLFCILAVLGWRTATMKVYGHIERVKAVKDPLRAA